MANALEKYFSISSLEHSTCLSIAKTYWKQPVVVEKLKELFCDLTSEFYEESHEDTGYNERVCNIFLELAMKMEEGIFKKLPGPIVMKFLDINLLIGCEILNWVYTHNKLYNIKRFFEDEIEVNYVDYLDCIKWNSLGLINYKESARKLCGLPQLSDKLKYILACSYCLLEEKNFIASKTDLSSWLLNRNAMLRIINSYPVIGLITPGICSNLLRLTTNTNRVLTVEENVFLFYIRQIYPLRDSHEEVILFLWSKFDEQQKLRHLAKFLSYVFNNVNMYSLVPKLTRYLRNTIEYTIDIEVFSFYDIKLFDSFRYIIPYFNEGNFIKFLNMLLLNVISEYTGDNRSAAKTRSNLLNNVVTHLYRNNDSLTPYNNLFYKYKKYRFKQYKFMFRKFFKYVRRENNRIKEKTFIGSLLYACVLNALRSDCDISKFTLSSISKIERLKFINAPEVCYEYAVMVLDYKFDQLNKFITFYFDSEDEDDIKKFKTTCFNKLVNCVVHNLNKYNCVKQLMVNVNMFIDHFSDIVCLETIQICKENLLSNYDVINFLFKSNFSEVNNKLDFNMLDNFFKWCLDIVENDKLNLFKNKLFDDERFHNSFLLLVFKLFKSNQYKFIDEIFLWCANNDTEKFRSLKLEFCIGESNRDRLSYLLFGLFQCDHNLQSFKDFVYWSFDSENNEESVSPFPKEFFDLKRLLYFLKHIVISCNDSEIMLHRKLKEFETILEWTSNVAGLELNQYKCKFMLSKNIVSQIFVEQSHPRHRIHKKCLLLLLKWLDPTPQVMLVFVNKFCEYEWFNSISPVFKSYFCK